MLKTPIKWTFVDISNKSSFFTYHARSTSSIGNGYVGVEFRHIKDYVSHTFVIGTKIWSIQYDTRNTLIVALTQCFCTLILNRIIILYFMIWKILANVVLLFFVVSRVDLDSSSSSDAATNSYQIGGGAGNVEGAERSLRSYSYRHHSRPKRVVPPATSIPRFRKYAVDDFNFLKVLGKGSFGKVRSNVINHTVYDLFTAIFHYTSLLIIL